MKSQIDLHHMINTLEFLAKENEKRKQLMELAFGSNSALLKFAESQYNVKNKFGTLDILDHQKKINMIINDSWSKSFQNESYKSIERSLMSLKNITGITENINRQVEVFSRSQFILKSNIELLTKSYNAKLFKGFNPILPAISEITKSFLKNVEVTDDNDVEELEIITTVTNRMNVVSENFIEKGDNNIRAYLLQINDSLSSLQQEVNALKPTKKDKWLNIIINFMTVIGFIALFYNPLNEKNEKLISETNKKVNNIDKRLEALSQNADNIISTNNYRCLRLSDVFLKPDKNSKRIGQIKKGQKIKILEVRKKYCCIAILPENNQDAIVGYMLINNTNFND